MSVAEISDHLADPLALLTLAPRTAPARQQTLRATIDWSFALLTAHEQTLLRRLATFSGGCTLEAAKAVCSGPDLPSEYVLDLLDRLVAKSLVSVVKDHDRTRYTLLETVRGYLQACLVAAGEDNALRARHRDWCIGVAERAQPELFDPEHLALLAFEEDNLRAALHWTLETQQAASAGRLAVGLASLWLMRGRFAEGRAHLMAVAQLPSSALSPLQTSLVCGWAAVLAHNEGAYLAVEDLANARTHAR